MGVRSATWIIGAWVALAAPARAEAATGTSSAAVTSTSSAAVEVSTERTPHRARGVRTATITLGRPIPQDAVRSTCTIDLADRRQAPNRERQAEATRTLSLDLEGLAWDGWCPFAKRLGEYLRVDTSPFEPGVAEESEHLLAATGYFSAVTCTATLASAALGCAVVPAPMVHDTRISGGLPFSLVEADIRRQVFLRPGTVLEESGADLRRQEGRVTEFLDRSGYYDSSSIVLAERGGGGGEPNARTELDVDVRVGQPLDVGDVHIDGDAIVPAGELEDRLRHYWLLAIIPRRFTPIQFEADIAEITRLLQREGYPEARVSTTLEPHPDAGAVDLHLHVDAGPKLVLHFHGNQALDDGDLTDLSTFLEAGSADAVEVENTLAAFKRAYEERGYYAASITSNIEEARVPGGGLVRSVTYTIEEGPRAEVEEVTLEGAAAFPPKRILKGAGVKTKASGLLSKGRWLDDQVKRDTAAIVDFYVARGFQDAKVEASRRVLRPGVLAVVFRVTEGPRRTIGHTTITGLPAEVDEKALRRSLKLVDGAPYVATDLAADRRAILTQLASKGHARAEVTRRMVLPSGSGHVDIEYRVTPGPLALLGGVFLRGNFRTRPSVIDDELHLEPGEPLDLVALTQARQRLRALGVFSSVELRRLDPWRTDPPSLEDPQHEVWLMVDLEERLQRTLDVVLSFATDDLLSVGTDFRDPNFLGRAIHLYISTRLSNASEVVSPKLRIGNIDAVDARLEAPHPLGLPFDADYSLFYRYKTTSSFFERRTGATAGASRVVLDESDCGICPRVSVRLGYELSAAAGTFVTELDQGTTPIARLVASTEHRRLDSSTDPREGFTGDLRVELANHLFAGPFSGAADFWRFFASETGFLNLGTPVRRAYGEHTALGGPVVVALGGRYGLAQPYGGQARVPFTEALFYGGDVSVRGLDERASFAAYPDQKHLFVGNLELRYYFLETSAGSFQLAAIGDVGTVAERLLGLFAATTLTAGGAFRWVTPIGPLSVAYAVPVHLAPGLVAHPEVAPPRGRVHVYFGYAF